MAEDKYALLRELLKEERGLFGKYYNQIKPSGGFTDYAVNLFDEALEIRVCSLVEELLSERDAFKRERDNSLLQKCLYGITMLTCDGFCSPFNCAEAKKVLAERDALIKEKEEKWWSETVTDIFVAGGIFGEDMIGECN